jgi:glycosyltransferase A (GT-A) superfamily protein (DUF2064 family)
VLNREQSATLHLLFLLRSVQRLGRMPVGELIVCYDPPEAGEVMPDLMGWLDQQRLIPQAQGDYAERVSAVFETVVRERGFGHVLVIGVDSPDVPEEHVRLAAELTLSADVTVGPTESGGVWCLGLSARVNTRELLRQIPWGSGGEAEALLDRAQSSRHATQSAPQWNEVDRPEELDRLMDRLAPSSDPDDVRLLAELQRTVPRENR